MSNLPAEPTDRQAEVLRLIARAIMRDGYPPTVRELCVLLGPPKKPLSTNGVNDHLKLLVRKGLLERDAVKSRGMRITRRGRAYVDAGRAA